jgi:hypothetical protein
MDFAKNKYGIAFVLIVAVAAIHYFFFYEPCEQPDEITVALTQLSCAQSVDPVAFRAAICKEIHNIEDCDLQEYDRPAVERFFLKKVNDCVKAELKSNNQCIDKYEDL